jgi:hypothetical protein
MRTELVPLSKIKTNPFRDLKLFPLDQEHVAELTQSINRHGFFGGIKARKRNGAYEAGCGVHRIEAARKQGLKSIEILIGDMSDDEMINLMCTENGTQAGGNAAAAMNDVAAVTRRLVEIMLGMDFATIVATYGKGLFDKKGYDSAHGKLIARINDPEKEGGVGERLVLAYLGGDKSPRSLREIRDAIKTLKDSGKYDDIVDDALDEYRQQEFEKTDRDGKAATTSVAKRPPKKPRRRIIDERAAAVFPNDNQFAAFKEAVTTETGKRFIPVEQQLKLAKEIVASGKNDPAFRKKQQGAPAIKAYVAGVIQEAVSEQREIDTEEKQRFMEEQAGDRIKAEVRSAKNAARSLMSSCTKLEKLYDQFPGHLMFGDIGGTLGSLISSLDQLRKKLRTI